MSGACLPATNTDATDRPAMTHNQNYAGTASTQGVLSGIGNISLASNRFHVFRPIISMSSQTYNVT